MSNAEAKSTGSEKKEVEVEVEDEDDDYESEEDVVKGEEEEDEDDDEDDDESGEERVIPRPSRRKVKKEGISRYQDLEDYAEDDAHFIVSKMVEMIANLDEDEDYNFGEMTAHLLSTLLPTLLCDVNYDYFKTENIVGTQPHTESHEEDYEGDLRFLLEIYQDDENVGYDGVDSDTIDAVSTVLEELTRLAELLTTEEQEQMTPDMYLKIESPTDADSLKFYNEAVSRLLCVSLLIDEKFTQKRPLVSIDLAPYSLEKSTNSLQEAIIKYFSVVSSPDDRVEIEQKILKVVDKKPKLETETRVILFRRNLMVGAVKWLKSAFKKDAWYDLYVVAVKEFHEMIADIDRETTDIFKEKYLIADLPDVEKFAKMLEDIYVPGFLKSDSSEFAFIRDVDRVRFHDDYKNWIERTITKLESMENSFKNLVKTKVPKSGNFLRPQIRVRNMINILKAYLEIYSKSIFEGILQIVNKPIPASAPVPAKKETPAPTPTPAKKETPAKKPSEKRKSASSSSSSSDSESEGGSPPRGRKGASSSTSRRAKAASSSSSSESESEEESEPPKKASTKAPSKDSLKRLKLVMEAAPAPPKLHSASFSSPVRATEIDKAWKYIKRNSGLQSSDKILKERRAMNEKLIKLREQKDKKKTEEHMKKMFKFVIENLPQFEKEELLLRINEFGFYEDNAKALRAMTYEKLWDATVEAAVRDFCMDYIETDKKLKLELERLSKKSTGELLILVEEHLEKSQGEIGIKWKDNLKQRLKFDRSDLLATSESSKRKK